MITVAEEPKVNVQYSCGCGFRTAVPNEAVSHSRKTGHTLSVLGEIRNRRPGKVEVNDGT